MPLVLQPATEADAPRAAQIESLAYRPSPFNKYLFPGPFPEPEPGRNPRAEEMIEILRNDPSIRWLKVVDTDIDPTEDNAQMVAFGQWHLKDGREAPEASRAWGPGCNAEACEALFGGMAQLRREYYGDQKHVHLMLLQVDPKHQRRGAGKMIVTHVIEKAKEAGLPAFLESSMEGHPLYLSCGFRDIGTHVVNFAKWGKDADNISYFMALEA
ncbi:acyl-CoA N-acyltransferase [Xylariaceae sp. FL0594]|nr:acyl-CoA N-acyltransferase [Xylariaceae sp. FL0594]